MTEPLLSIQDLSVAFRQGGGDMLAVDRVSFDVDFVDQPMMRVAEQHEVAEIRS